MPHGPLSGLAGVVFQCTWPSDQLRVCLEIEAIGVWVYHNVLGVNPGGEGVCVLSVYVHTCR